MANKTFDVVASEVGVIAYSIKDVSLTFRAEVAELLDQLSTEEIVSSIGASDLLDEIGRANAMSHWGLVEDNGE